MGQSYLGVTGTYTGIGTALQGVSPGPQGSLLMQQREILKPSYDLLADSSRDTGRIM